MKIAIVSDTHGRTATVAKALALIEPHGVTHILHCGDIDDPDTVELFPKHTHFVFGNCDTERSEIRRRIEKIGANLQEPFGHLELDGVNIAWVHSDSRGLFHDLEHSGHFQYLFYGHTHVRLEHRTGPTRVINPGALHRAAEKTFAILDVATGIVETILV